jgi:hypothetical protein
VPDEPLLPLPLPLPVLLPPPGPPEELADAFDPAPVLPERMPATGLLAPAVGAAPGPFAGVLYPQAPRASSPAIAAAEAMRRVGIGIPFC